MNGALLTIILVLVSQAALAQTVIGQLRAPFDPALIITYLWVMALACLGGVASFVQKVRSGQARAFNLVELVGEMFIAALAGIVTFFLCTWAGVNDWLAAALIAISGHGGSRFFFVMERQVERFYERLFGNVLPNDPGPKG